MSPEAMIEQRFVEIGDVRRRCAIWVHHDAPEKVSALVEHFTVPRLPSAAH